MRRVAMEANLLHCGPHPVQQIRGRLLTAPLHQRSLLLLDGKPRSLMCIEQTVSA
jgi:hypothetical protein